MKLIEHHQAWDVASSAIVEGHFVRHAHWGVNQPMSQPDYVGPTAAGADTNGKLAVFTDDGIKIHDWEPCDAERASLDWQIVNLTRKPGELLAAAQALALPQADAPSLIVSPDEMVTPRLGPHPRRR